MMQEKQTDRTELLIGREGICFLNRCTVTVIGLGGVGGHCAEALARAGIGRLHLIDADEVRPSNLNRQLAATKKTIGMKKTAAMRERIEEVSECAVTCAEVFVEPGNVEEVIPEVSDFIVDAIDSVPGKIAVAVFAYQHEIPEVSCMGAGNRMDPTAFRIRDIYDTKGCPLARKMRQELRKREIERLPVIVSEEEAVRQPGQTQIGSIAPVPAAAGLAAAGYVLRELLKQTNS